MKTVMMASTYGGFFWMFEQSRLEILKKKGFNIYIVANFDDVHNNRNTMEYKKMGIKMINIPFARSPFSWKTFSNFVKLRKTIRVINPDIVDCHLAVVGVLCRLACWFEQKRKIIYSPHGFFFYKGCPKRNKIIYKTIESFLARKTDALITINREDYANAKQMRVRGKAYYVPGIGVKTEEIYQVPGNTMIRDELGIRDDEFLFISVGELNINKNHIIVIKAIGELIVRGYNNFHYIICGEGEERKKIEKLAKELNIEDRIHLVGYRLDVVNIDKAADVFILPSFKEGLSVSIIEAMACGLPVLASRIRGNVDLIKEEKGGYLFSPTDSKALADLMGQILDHKKSCREMGDFNLNESKQYSYEKVYNTIRNIYEDVIKK